jgi:hypothetical protein
VAWQWWCIIDGVHVARNDIMGGREKWAAKAGWNENDGRGQQNLRVKYDSSEPMKGVAHLMMPPFRLCPVLQGRSL